MKKTVCLVAFVTLLFAVNVFAYNCINDTDNLILKNGQQMDFDNPVYTIDNLTYVPLREFSEKLGIQVNWIEHKRQVVLDTNHKKVLYDKDIKANSCLENGVIPDELTAKNVAKAILESCTGRPMEYKDGDYEYYLETSFFEPSNCWIVTQYATYKGEFFGGGNVSPHIQINKLTGEIISVNLNPSWDKIRQGHQSIMSNTESRFGK